MKRKPLRTLSFIVIGALVIGSFYWYYSHYRFTREAQQILEETGVKGGLIVHLGCEDSKLTAALHAGDRYIVHGLARSKKDVERARQRILKKGLYGEVTIEQLEGGQLTYIDNLVNLLVVQQAGNVDMGEIMRVLTPGGVACLREDGEWRTKTKPRSGDIDEWTHFLHGPDNNAVARDREAGPPRRMQWLSEPMWIRSHHTLASISSVVSSGGRVFYIADESPAASMDISSNWKLVARDAFNGTLLWKKSISTWTDHLRSFRSGPVQLPRLLVAENDRVYVPLGVNDTLKALDAATGKVVRTYPQAQRVEEIVVNDGLVFAVTGKPVPEQAVNRQKWQNESEQPRKTLP
ncbi:MAG: PQQ-binding-like beta-propeller repeat protein, partial [Bacteroidales bacterium]|nr:PQQ-binding-like beta-propeller repeat protein [Bacteroidales bacterium]